MEWVDTTDLTKIVLRSVSMELVERKRLFSLEQIKLSLMDLNHERILTSTDRAVARRELREVCRNGEDHGSAMATTGVR